ncbi:MAG: complex subunit family protein, partial [Sphingomonas bacterium]|nr:complex subunit family protein [Sphingomonas bacterium]
MKDRLVILIGGGGFLGRYVAQELLKAGARVRIAQRDPREALFLKPLGGLGQI